LLAKSPYFRLIGGPLGTKENRQGGKKTKGEEAAEDKEVKPTK